MKFRSRLSEVRAWIWDRETDWHAPTHYQPRSRVVNILVIPAASTASERVFFTDGGMLNVIHILLSSLFFKLELLSNRLLVYTTAQQLLGYSSCLNFQRSHMTALLWRTLTLIMWTCRAMCSFYWWYGSITRKRVWLLVGLGFRRRPAVNNLANCAVLDVRSPRGARTCNFVRSFILVVAVV